MRIITDITPTSETECVFRVGRGFCSALGDQRRCIPIEAAEFNHEESVCPYCISFSDYNKEQLIILERCLNKLENGGDDLDS